MLVLLEPQPRGTLALMGISLAGRPSISLVLGWTMGCVLQGIRPQRHQECVRVSRERTSTPPLPLLKTQSMMGGPRRVCVPSSLGRDTPLMGPSSRNSVMPKGRAAPLANLLLILWWGTSTRKSALTTLGCHNRGASARMGGAEKLAPAPLLSTWRTRGFSRKTRKWGP